VALIAFELAASEHRHFVPLNHQEQATIKITEITVQTSVINKHQNAM
jgi:hypothetical protein